MVKFIFFLTCIFVIFHHIYSVSIKSITPNLTPSYSLEIQSDSIHRISFGSCYNTNKGRGEVWDLLRALEPRQFLSLGDIIYADFNPDTGAKRFFGGTPQMIEEEFVKLYQNKPFVDFIKSLDKNYGFLIVYDDHDYGINNGDKTYRYRNESMNLFRNYFPNFKYKLEIPKKDLEHWPTEVIKDLEGKLTEISMEDGELKLDNIEHRQGNGPYVQFPKSGMYTAEKFTIKDSKGNSLVYKIVLVDSRSNKDVKGTKNGSFLGEEQWAWLEDEIDPFHISNQDVDLLLFSSSIQVLPDDKLLEENWSEFPNEREKLLGLLAKFNQHSNVAILSGDIHSAEFDQAYCSQKKFKSEEEKLNNRVHLFEATSSGLSHTLPELTPHSSAKNYEKYLEIPPSKDYLNSNPQAKHYPVIPSVPRGWFYKQCVNLYQMFYPGHYRELKYSHSKHTLHVGLIDIDIENRVVNFKMVNRFAEIIMSKPLILKPKTTVEEREAEKLRIKSLNPAEKEDEEFICEPFWGPTPAWKVTGMKAVLSWSLLMTVVLPVLTILWFVGASLYYLCMGREINRRRRIEKKYQELNAGGAFNNPEKLKQN